MLTVEYRPLDVLLKARQICGERSGRRSMRECARQCLELYQSGDVRTANKLPEMSVGELRILHEASECGRWSRL